MKNYLKDGDSIWIVANIKRAVDDKTAKDMLGESFRRQLLMDGQVFTFITLMSSDFHGMQKQLAARM